MLLHIPLKRNSNAHQIQKKKKSIDIKLTKDIHIGWVVENYQIDSTLHVSDTKT